jgi:hypothetical protein
VGRRHHDRQDEAQHAEHRGEQPELRVEVDHDERNDMGDRRHQPHRDSRMESLGGDRCPRFALRRSGLRVYRQAEGGERQSVEQPAANLVPADGERILPTGGEHDHQDTRGQLSAARISMRC